MTSAAWRVALGVTSWSAFFWGAAGAVDLGLVRTRNGYALPDGGGWYQLALLAGLVAGYFAVASLTDLIPPRRMAAIPAVGAVAGAVTCLLLGQQVRHWVAAPVLLLAGAVPLAAVHLRERAATARQNPNRPA